MLTWVVVAALVWTAAVAVAGFVIGRAMSRADRAEQPVPPVRPRRAPDPDRHGVAEAFADEASAPLS